MRRAVTGAALGLLLPLTFTPDAGAATAYDAADACDEGGIRDEVGTDVEAEGVLPDALNLAALPAGADGSGVRVAVVDAPVSARAGLPVDRGANEVEDAHGTMVAGLIHAVAPKAQLLSYKVVDGRGEASDRFDTTVSSDDVAGAIRQAVQAGADIVNLSLVTGESPELEDALQLARSRGVLVVAAVGNRLTPGETELSDEDAFHPGESRVGYPASAPGVLGVTGLSHDLQLDPAEVMTGPEVDLSAPAWGAKTVDAMGRACLVGSSGSSWATAVVSGVAALVREAHPQDSAAQVAGRLMATAQGGITDAALDGHGLVQPVAALTAELQLDAQGRPLGFEPVEQVRDQVAAPTPQTDHRDDRRSTLVWWGLGGGGVLVAALLLRPLLVRQRPE